VSIHTGLAQLSAALTNSGVDVRDVQITITFAHFDDLRRVLNEVGQGEALVTKARPKLRGRNTIAGLAYSFELGAAS